MYLLKHQRVSPRGDVQVSAEPAGGKALVMGWAFDPPQIADSIDVDVILDGKGVGRWNAAAPSDCLYAYGVPGRHAFVGYVPASPGEHRICVRGLNRGIGRDVMLGCSTVTVVAAVNHNPEGSLTPFARSNSIYVNGYVIDRSNLYEPVQLAAFRGSTLVASSWADKDQPSLRAYGVPGGHGVSMDILLSTTGEATCVLAINRGAGLGVVAY